MKMEAMNHQGTSGGISAKDIGKNGNDSARQVYRYIRLTYLMNDLLNAVDRDVIAGRCRAFLSCGSRTGDGGESA